MLSFFRKTEKLLFSYGFKKFSTTMLILEFREKLEFYEFHQIRDWNTFFHRSLGFLSYSVGKS